jgi:DNA-binding MarR family transcriptional regulator
VERHERETTGVREQVLTQLNTPCRPGDLARALGCDPSQVSRALRELRATGDVVEVSPPDGYAGDRRAHWFARSQTQISGPAAA